MTRSPLIARLRAGDPLHMQIIAGRRVWWMESPHLTAAEADVMASINGGHLQEAGDSLFGLPMNSQTWEGQP